MTFTSQKMAIGVGADIVGWLAKQGGVGVVAGEPKDAWSTWHRRARKAKIQYLEAENGVFACEDCGRGPTDLPASDQFWLDHPNARDTLRLADPEKRVPNLRLEVDHSDKNIENISPENLALLCNSCHKLRDNKTAVGEAQEGSDRDVHGYALAILSDSDFEDPNYVDPTVKHQRKSLPKSSPQALPRAKASMSPKRIADVEDFLYEALDNGD